jgi:two-component system, NarL family, sensor kinase
VVASHSAASAAERPFETRPYFTVSEALTNLTESADATHAWVKMHHRASSLDIELGDHGVGGLDTRRGRACRACATDIAAVGGTLRITRPPNRGTIVRARLPVDDTARTGA